MKKRVFSLALALVLCLGLAPTVALAAEESGVTEFLPLGRYDWIEPFDGGLAAVGIKVGTNSVRDPIYKWGFIDEQGNEVIPCRYDNREAPVFVDGLAWVQVGDEYGYIDKTGKEIVPIGQAPYSWLTPSEGLIPIRKQTGTGPRDGEPIYKWGFVDTTGKLVVPCKYKSVQSFSEGLAVVEDESWKQGFINTKGEVVIPCQYDIAQDFSEGLAAVCYRNAAGQLAWGYIDKTGKVVVSNKYGAYGTYSRHDEEASPFTDGLAKVGRDYKWGFIDKTGKEVVPIKYEEVRLFSEGIAAVRGETDEVDRNGFPITKWGFVDKTGKELTPLKYDKVEDFSDGYAKVEARGLGGRTYVDTTGKEIVCRGTSGFNYHDGLMAVENDQWKWGFVDKTGRQVIPCQYYEVKEFSEGLAAVQDENLKWGFIDTTGKEVIPPQFETVESFSEGFARVGQIHKVYEDETQSLFFGDPTYAVWGLIDTTGKQVIPYQYEGLSHKMEDFHHGYAKIGVKIGKYPWDNWGLVNSAGQEIVPLSSGYAEIDYLSGDLWRVQKDGTCGVLSIPVGVSAPTVQPTPTPTPAPSEEPVQRGVLTYTQAVAPQYEDAQEFSEGLAAVKKDGKWGYINESGEVVVPFQYDLAYVFNEGYAVVGTVEHNAKYTKEQWVEGENGEEDSWEYVDVLYDACYLGFIDKGGNYKPFIYPGQDEDGNEVSSEVRRDIKKVRTDTPWAYIFHNGYFSIYSEHENIWWGGTEMWCDIFDTTGKKVTTGSRTAYPINEGIMINGNSYDSSQWYENMATGETFTPGGGKPSPFDDDYYNLRPFNQGLAPVCVGKYENGEVNWSGWGFVDKMGNWVIEPMEHEIVWIQGMETTYEIFGETGIALLGSKNGNWGGIDKTGKTVIPFQYDGLHAASEGLMGFKENGKWGFLDAGTLEVAIPAQFDQVTLFNNGYAVAATMAADGTPSAHLIDRKGNFIPGSDQLDRDTYFREAEDSDDPDIYTPSEYVVIEENGKYGYGHIEYLPELPQQEDMSGWAFEEVTTSIENDLVPVKLQNLYDRNINRSEFCQMAEAIIMAVNDQDIDDVVLAKTGKSLDDHLHTYPFKDTTSRSVAACYALGIVNGRGANTFDPYSSITRQEAATMLSRLADVLGVSGGQAVSFADADSFAAWAAPNIAKVSSLVDPTSGKAVMGGTGGGNFSPLETYTREQAYATALRLYHAAKAQ